MIETTKDETTKIEAIKNSILKRFLRTPKTTAKELIFIETAFRPISAMIDSRQIRTKNQSQIMMPSTKKWTPGISE